MRIHVSLTPIVCVDNILEIDMGLVKACDKKKKDVASGLIDALEPVLRTVDLGRCHSCNSCMQWS